MLTQRIAVAILAVAAAAVATAAAADDTDFLASEEKPNSSLETNVSSFSMAQLVRMIYRQLYTRCIFFLAPSNSSVEERRHLLDALRTLAWRGVGASVLSYPIFVHHRHHLHCDSRPLYVVPRANAGAAQFLRQVSQMEDWNLNGATPLNNDTAAMLERPMWLVFASNLTDEPLRNYLEGVDIPFDCQVVMAGFRRIPLAVLRRFRGLPPGKWRKEMTSIWALREVWRVGPDQPLQFSWLGALYGGNLTLDNKPFYDRRPSMAGATVRVIAKSHPPFTIVHENPDGGVIMDGLVGRIWRVLEKGMNFSTQVVHKMDDDVSNEGLIEILRKGNVDLGVVDTSVRADRIGIIQFSLPIMRTQYRVFIERPTFEYVRWGSPLAPFQPSLWLCALVSLCAQALVLSACAALLYRWANAGAEAPNAYTLPQALFVVVGAFCMQGQDRTPRSCACRLVFMCAYISSLTLTAAYSAGLISSLTFKEYRMPFDDIEGLLKDGRYRFGAVLRSTPVILMEMSQDPTLQRLSRWASHSERANWPVTTTEALHRTCNEHFATLLSADAATSLSDGTCPVVALGAFGLTASEALPVRRGWPFLGLLNHNLVRMRRSGALMKLMREIQATQSVDGTAEAETLTAVDLGAAAPVLAALAAGAVAAAVALMVERAWAGLRGRDRSRLHSRAATDSPISARAALLTRHGGRRKRFLAVDDFTASARRRGRWAFALSPV